MGQLIEWNDENRVDTTSICGATTGIARDDSTVGANESFSNYGVIVAVFSIMIFGILWRE